MNEDAATITERSDTDWFTRTPTAAPTLPEGLHPVIDVIRRRLAEGSVPGQRTDPHVVALAIEGGGMRGVLSAGMTLALESLQTRAAFDRVYGSSAGSMMGAYFIAGQSALAPSIYIQDLPNRTFISRRRLISSRPVMNLDYLVDQVIEALKPLDYDIVLTAPIELHVLVSSIRDGATVDVTDFRSKAQLREAMRASARLPGIGGDPVVIDEVPCMDSGLTDSLAFTAALRGGASHVLVLKTRTDGAKPEYLSSFQRRFMRRVLHVPDEVIELVAVRPDRYEKETRELKRLCALGPGETPQVFAVGPRPEDPTVGRLGRDRGELVNGALVGIRSVFRAFRLPEPQLFEVFKPYWHPGD